MRCRKTYVWQAVSSLQVFNYVANAHTNSKQGYFLHSPDIPTLWIDASRHHGSMHPATNKYNERKRLLNKQGRLEIGNSKLEILNRKPETYPFTLKTNLQIN